METDFENRIVAPEYLDVDSDVELQLRPRTLSDYIGQTKVKENLSVYIEAAKKIDSQKSYPLNEALALVKESAFAKFDETVELSIRLNLKKSQTVRDTLVLPNQFGAEKRILVFAKGEKATEAKNAGALYVGDDDLVEKIKNGWTEFDIAIATPDMMKDVGRLGPILGRRGLMPNPKTKTVTFDVAEAIAELQKGRVEFRSDKTGVVHLQLGKSLWI